MARGSRFLTVGFVALLALCSSLVQPVLALTRSPASASYRVHLTSDKQGHTWVGTESVTFTNNSNKPMRTVWFHLWSNGVKGCGAHAITVAHIEGGTPGGMILSCTSLPIHLDHPLDAHRTATISMHVKIQLFHRNDRFGFNAGISFLGTALPILAVHDDHGWNLNPFSDIGESFYSLVSNYRVTLVTPTFLQTPTTGVLQSSTTNGSRSVRTYVAHQVRDFEWAAAQFHHVTGTADGIHVQVSYLPALVSAAEARQARSTAVHSMTTYSSDFGSYPYPEIEVVLTGPKGFGGMEYPTVVFADPRARVITHELAHQWFYGLVGDDQFREPWLDESFATWASALPLGGAPSCASYNWPNSRVRLNSSMAYFRRVPEAYGVAYFAGRCMLSQLSDQFGAGQFLSVLQGYVAANRFGVARTSDFKHAVAAAARTQLPGFDLTAFWRTWRLNRT